MGIQAIVQTPDVTFHLTKWYAMEERFLFKDDYTFDVFLNTDSLSHKISVAG